MRKRAIKKLLRQPERMRPYGRRRASGSKKLRRGRRSMLRFMPETRDRSNLDPKQQLRLLERDLLRLAPDLRCARTVCDRPAIHRHRDSGRLYCTSCARRINRECDEPVVILKTLASVEG